MKINITIVEDEDIFASTLKNEIDIWAKANGISIDVLWFNSIKKATQNDCISSTDAFFLDISIGPDNGVDFAKYLRSCGYKGIIIFLTSYKEYVFEGYEVHALDYLLKPISAEKLNKCLQTISTELHDQYYILKNRNDFIRITYKDILYISSANHNIEIYTNTQTYTQAIGLNEVLTHLPLNFQMCHRTIIVNMQNVTRIEDKFITLSNGVQLPIGKKHLVNIRTAFLRS